MKIQSKKLISIIVPVVVIGAVATFGISHGHKAFSQKKQSNENGIVAETVLEEQTVASVGSSPIEMKEIKIPRTT